MQEIRKYCVVGHLIYRRIQSVDLSPVCRASLHDPSKYHISTVLKCVNSSRSMTAPNTISFAFKLTIPPSTVPRVTNFSTQTSPNTPILWALCAAWFSARGFHQGPTNSTLDQGDSGPLPKHRLDTYPSNAVIPTRSLLGSLYHA
jgi:hypothetical protein